MKPISLFKKIMYKLYPLISDKLYILLFIYFKTHKLININSPQTFTEKVNYLKTQKNVHKASYSDKIYVKKLIADLNLDIFIPKTLWTGKSLKDVEWNKLPDKFVIKANHFSGDITVVEDISKIDKMKITKYYDKLLKYEYHRFARENSYKEIVPKVLIEEFLGDDKSLSDYKFFMFNGEFQFCHVVEDRFTDLKDYMVDKNFKNLNFNLDTRSYIHSRNPVFKPNNYEAMIKISSKIAEKFDFVRVDLYDIKGKIYFGECTFYPWGGAFRILPKSRVKEIDHFYGRKLKIEKDLLK